MTDVLINFTLPTERDLGEPFTREEIAFVEIRMSADGGENFSGLVQIPQNPEPKLDHLVEGLDPGTYIFHGIIEDTDGRRSDHKEAIAGLLSKPAQLPTFTVTIQ